MTSQVIFKLDKTLKAQAMKKAQKEGVALSAVLKLATKAFVDGELNVGLVTEEKFNAKTARDIRQAIKDLKEGKNLSPVFHSAEEMINYLDGVAKSKRKQKV